MDPWEEKTRMDRWGGGEGQKINDNIFVDPDLSTRFWQFISIVGNEDVFSRE